METMEAREKGVISLILKDCNTVCLFHNVPPFRIVNHSLRSNDRVNDSFKQKIPSSNRDEETLRGTTLVTSTT